MTWLSVDFGIWGCLITVWLAMAPFSRKTVKRENPLSRLAYLAPILPAALLFSRVPLGMPWLETRWLAESDVAGALSVAMTAAGVGFAIWARLTLGKNWSGTVTVKQDHTLVQTGPYAFARHPIYTGILFGLLGTTLAYGSPRAMLGALLFVLPFRVKMRVEERFMRGEFGAAYDDYAGRVKALVPYVW
jgi:protein-S-isoprenylcysteine O-methyltransferase Ste14